MKVLGSLTNLIKNPLFIKIATLNVATAFILTAIRVNKDAIFQMFSRVFASINESANVIDIILFFWGVIIGAAIFISLIKLER